MVLSAEFEAGVTVGASRTDNVFLAVSPNEVDDIIWQASPFFIIKHTSPMLDANLNYRLNWLRYADLKRTSNFHTGLANVTGKFLQDSLNVEVGVQRSQVLSDPEDAIPSGRLQLGSNLSDLDQVYVNPRLVRDLGKVVTLRANYRYTENNYNDSLVQEDMNHAGSIGVDNYKSGQGVTWAFRYNWQRTEFDISTPFEYQQAAAELGFWVNSKTRVFASGGQESDFSMPFDPALEDSFWEAGFAHTAGEKLRFEFAAGERTFGSSWRGNLDFAFRRGNMSLSYTELPTTPSFSQGGTRRSVLAVDDFTDFLNRPGSAERFLSSRLQWSLDLNFRRTGFRLVAFDEDRSERVALNGLALGDQSQSGANANISWQAGARTTFGVNGGVVNRETTAANRAKLVTAGITVGYRLGARTSLSLGYSYNDAEPRGQGLAGQNYVANIVSLLFTITN